MGDVLLSMMNELEAIGEEVTDALLDEARNTMFEPDFQIVMAVLVLPDGKRRVAHCNFEYGDGEGTSQMRETVADIKSQLKDGEKVELRMLSLSINETIANSTII